MGNLKVVIADDEERICQLIQALINWDSLGMEIAGMAHNGIEAFDVVQKVCPDILITDIRMPGLSGLELIEKVKAACPEVEIIIISGYAHFEKHLPFLKFFEVDNVVINKRIPFFEVCVKPVDAVAVIHIFRVAAAVYGLCHYIVHT